MQFFQDVVNNFEIDIFKEVILEIQKYSNKKYIFNKREVVTSNTDYKIIVDHLRSSIFAIADGANPSANGRGYVIRKLIRRAVMSSINLKLKNFSIVNLVPVIIEQMKYFYPYLVDKTDNIIKILLKEEKSYLNLISSARSRIEKLIKNKKDITSKEVFYMFETYGFPYEIISKVLISNGFSVNKDDFDKYYKEHQEKAKNSTFNVGMDAQNKEILNLNLHQVFRGYESDVVKESEVLIMLDDKLQNQLSSISKGERAVVILSETPFYATSGGQLHDIGKLFNNSFSCNVIKVEKGQNGLFYHYVEVENGIINKGDNVTAEINSLRRRETEKNHSSTHLIFSILENILKTELPQVGSYNDDKKLRFDFTYDGLIKDDLIEQTDFELKKLIDMPLEREYAEMPIQDAKKLGASYMKNENYKDIVRVVSFGGKIIDLCGGTHVKNTNEIEKIYISEIKNQGANVYRVVAFSGEKQINSYFKSELDKWKKELTPTINKVNDLEFDGSKADKIILECKDLIRSLGTSLNKKTIDSYINVKNIVPKKLSEIEGIRKSIISLKLVEMHNKELLGEITKDNYIVELNDVNLDSARNLAMSFKNNDSLENRVIWVITSLSNDKFSFIALKNKKFGNDLSLVEMLKTVGKDVGIRGGGNSEFIQGVSSKESIAIILIVSI